MKYDRNGAPVTLPVRIGVAVITLEVPRMALALEDWNRIRSARVFTSLSEDDFRIVVGAPREEVLAEGRTLFVQGAPATAFYLVLEGWIVLIRRQADGDRAVVKLVGPGESFAEALVAQGVHYPVTSEAATAVRLVRFDTATFRTHIVNNPRIALAIIAACYRQLHELIEHLEHVKTWSTRRRLACFILNAAPSRSGPATIELPVDRGLIAARLGMTASTLSRTFGLLLPLGVSTEGRTVHVADLAALSRFVERQ